MRLSLLTVKILVICLLGWSFLANGETLTKQSACKSAISTYFDKCMSSQAATPSQITACITNIGDAGASLMNCLDKAKSEDLTEAKIRACGRMKGPGSSAFICLEFAALAVVTETNIYSCGQDTGPGYFQCLEKARNKKSQVFSTPQTPETAG